MSPAVKGMYNDVLLWDARLTLIAGIKYLVFRGGGTWSLDYDYDKISPDEDGLWTKYGVGNE